MHEVFDQPKAHFYTQRTLNWVMGLMKTYVLPPLLHESVMRFEEVPSVCGEQTRNQPLVGFLHDLVIFVPADGRQATT